MAEDTITKKYFIDNRDNLTVPTDEKYVVDNFIINTNIGEGNCLFHSVSQYVDVDPVGLRQMLCVFYREYNSKEYDVANYQPREAFEKIYKKISDVQHSAMTAEYDKHRTRICTKGEWGTSTDLKMISIILNITVILFSFNNDQQKTYNVQVFVDNTNLNNYENVIFIKFSGRNHFESMQLKNTKIPIAKIKPPDNQVGKSGDNRMYTLNESTADELDYIENIPHDIKKNIYSLENLLGARNIDVNIDKQKKTIMIVYKLIMRFKDQYDDDIRYPIKILLTYFYDSDTITKINITTTIDQNERQNHIQETNKEIAYSPDTPDDTVSTFIDGISEASAFSTKHANEETAKKDAYQEEEEKKRKGAATKKKDAKKVEEKAAKPEENKNGAATNKEVEANGAVASNAAANKAVATTSSIGTAQPATSDGCKQHTFTATKKGGRKKRKTKRKKRKANSKARLRNISRTASLRAGNVSYNALGSSRPSVPKDITNKYKSHG